MWMKIMWVAIGGAIGAVARVELARLVERVVPEMSIINWGLLTVNVLGCFLFGVIWSIIKERAGLNEAAAWGLLGGFLGAFTTFSTFAFEASAIKEVAGTGWMAVHLVSHNVLGVVAIFLGLALGRWVG